MKALLASGATSVVRSWNTGDERIFLAMRARLIRPLRRGMSRKGRQYAS
jgi:hypothetical protein